MNGCGAFWRAFSFLFTSSRNRGAWGGALKIAGGASHEPQRTEIEAALGAWRGIFFARFVLMARGLRLMKTRRPLSLIAEMKQRAPARIQRSPPPPSPPSSSSSSSSLLSLDAQVCVFGGRDFHSRLFLARGSCKFEAGSGGGRGGGARSRRITRAWTIAFVCWRRRLHTVASALAAVMTTAAAAVASRRHINRAQRRA